MDQDEKAKDPPPQDRPIVLYNVYLLGRTDHRQGAYARARNPFPTSPLRINHSNPPLDRRRTIAYSSHPHHLSPLRHRLPFFANRRRRPTIWGGWVLLGSTWRLSAWSAQPNSRVQFATITRLARGKGREARRTTVTGECTGEISIRYFFISLDASYRGWLSFSNLMFVNINHKIFLLVLVFKYVIDSLNSIVIN